MQRDFQVAVIGSGFAGTILARVLAAQRLQVVLLERGSHPRFALGESTTPLANLSLERLAARYRLPDLHQLAAYGRWSRHLPHLRRGLKRGFSFYAHERGRPYTNSAENEARLLVAASPNDRSADSHWLRADVDHHLVLRAIEEGVTYLDHTEIERVTLDSEGVDLWARRGSDPLRVRALWVIDASGRHGVLARDLEIESRTERMQVDTGLLYGHFEGVEEIASVAPEAHFGDAPYAEHRAALHHLLDIGWLYHLPFDPPPDVDRQGRAATARSSLGLVLRNDRLPLHPDQLHSHPERALRVLLAAYPSLAASLEPARVVEAVRYVPRIQHRLDQAAGPRWILLPHAYAFVDPLFSTGMAWSLLAVERLGQFFGGAYGDVRAYSRLLRQEADQVERLIEAAYLAMDTFDDFSAVCALYFATVSFAETYQRLTVAGQRPHAWSGFLGAADPVLETLFVQARDRLARDRAGKSRSGGRARPGSFAKWLRSRLAPRDVIGIDSPPRPGIYPIDLDALLERADRLGLERQEVFAALPRLRGEGD